VAQVDGIVSASTARIEGLSECLRAVESATAACVRRGDHFDCVSDAVGFFRSEMTIVQAVAVQRYPV
jgi:hypothetical protein